MIGLNIFVLIPIIKPIMHWRVKQPRMLASTMIEDHVHYQFHSTPMQALCQPDIIFICPQPRVYFIIISCGITVIRTFSHIIFQHGCCPDGSNSQTIHLIKMLHNTRQITAMPGIDIFTIYSIGIIHFYLVIAFIAISKAIRHQ